MSTCQWAYAPGSDTRRGLPTLDLTLNWAGERVRLRQQVHLLNAP